MDENSCENETSGSAGGQKAKETENVPQLEDVGIKLNFDTTGKENSVLGPRGSPFDASVSGPSTSFLPPRTEYGRTEPKLFVLPEVISETSREGAQTPTINPEPPLEDEEGLDELSGYVEDVEERIEYPKIPRMTDERREAAAEPPTPPAPPPSPSPSRPPSPPPPLFDESQDVQPRVRLAPGVEAELSTRRPSVGPPPSYSFVMKQKKKLKSVPSIDPTITSNPPPPSYAGAQGLYLAPDERVFNFPSFAEPIWRSHSQPALCPRCGIIVLTTTHTHDSLATHVAALALCLFGCWPCCLIPYCMNVCKNTFHHCPICQTFLGLYRPW